MCLLNVRSIYHKAIAISEYITDNNIDIFVMTESWMLKNNDSNRVIIDNLVPQGYKIIHNPRSKDKGGDVGMVFKNTLYLQMQQSTSYLSFEYVKHL